MGTLIVKLTATGGANDFTNPANAQDSDNVYATRTGAGTLERTTGDHDGSNLGTITMVEVGLEHFESANGGSDGVLTGGYGASITFGNIVHRTVEGVDYVDVTVVHTWAWSDFNSDVNLLAKWEVDTALVDYSVDQLFFRVTYTPTVPGQKAYNFGFTTIASIFTIILKRFKSIRRRRWNK